MTRVLRCAAWAFALTINAPATAATAARLSMDIPAGFDALAAKRVVMVDLYFGEQKLGEALAEVEPGHLRFRDPAAVVALLPSSVRPGAVEAALAGDLDTHAGLVCMASNAGDCGVLGPEIAGIIYDEGRFRVDLFINERFLGVSHEAGTGYLPAPRARLSLTNALGLAAAGTIGGRTDYNVQNRTILGFANARLKANTSLTSNLGFLIDDLAGELERKDMRFSAGLFWVPGNEFTGQRRVLGAGFGTQFDTALDRETLQGTPLILFMPRPARVEILIDGRLVGSRTYAAGSNQLDTSGLPSGSYSVVLRVHEANGSVRDERRFFVKQAAVPPSGRPIVYGYAGLLANTRAHRPVSLSRDVYYQAGTAWRLTNALAFDAAVIGTQRKTLIEAGGWLISGPARLRAAGLLSNAGDRGALVQLVSAGGGPLSITFDVRRIWSRGGGPLLPLPATVDSFDGTQPTGVQLANGSYAQATGSVGLRLGDAFLSLVGSYRKDRRLPADYSLGPSVTWPVLTRNQLSLVLEGSAQRTRTTTAGFLGARLLFTSGPMSMLSTVGGRFENGRDGSGGSRSRAVSSFSAQYSHETAGQTRLTFEGGLDRDVQASALRGAATLESSLGNARADLLHNLEGRGGTQYGLSFQSGLALGSDAAAWAGRGLDQSAILVSMGGDAPDVPFDVLIDNVARGRVRAGQRFSMFLPAYRTYKVRVVPAEAAAVSYDSQARDVTLYPGSVGSLSWRADKTFALFAQAIGPGGAAIANALVESSEGVAETDGNGYFQIDTRQRDRLKLTQSGEGTTCVMQLGDIAVSRDFASVGKVTCK